MKSTVPCSSEWPRFVDVMSFTRKRPEVIVFCMRLVPTMDATGIEALETVIRRAHAQNVKILLSGVNPRIRKIMARLGTDELVGLITYSLIFHCSRKRFSTWIRLRAARCTSPKQFTATTA